MKTGNASPFDHPVSHLALEVFRLNGALIAAGDELVAPLGLTSARWQVMGAVAEADGGLPVAGLARSMGLVRQSVQRIADELEAEGIVRFTPNPHHRRARLVQLTEHGEALLAEARRRWLPLANTLMKALGDDAVRAADTLRTAREYLRQPQPQEEAV